MKEITIRNFAPGDERRMAEVQARCVAACPDTSRFPPSFWLGPGFENGQNIFCAVNGQDELLGYRIHQEEASLGRILEAQAA